MRPTEFQTEFQIYDYLRATSEGKSGLPEWRSTFTPEELADLHNRPTLAAITSIEDIHRTWVVHPFAPAEITNLGEDFVYRQGEMLFRWRMYTKPFALCP